MKQIIPFVKDVSLDTRISEITSIALEHNLQMENSDSIVGEFTVSGKYKINDISVNEEVFEKEIPFDITLDDKYDASKVQIDIDDFYYEIINDEILRIHIDVLANNLVYYKEPEPQIEEIEEPELIVPEEAVMKDEDVRSEAEVEVIEPELKTEVTEEVSDLEKKKEVREEPTEEPQPERNEEMVTQEVKAEEVSEEKVVLEQTNEKERETETDVAKNLTSSFMSDTEKYSTYKIHIIRENETVEMIKEMYNVTNEELEKYNALDNVVLGTKLIIPLSDE